MAKYNWRRVLEIFMAEFLGAATFVFVGCAGTMHGIPMVSGINFGLAFGFVIGIFGDISSHINPILTTVGVILGIIPLIYYPVYLVAQFLGGVIGMALLMVVTPKDMYNAGATHCLKKNFSEETDPINETVIIPLCCQVPDPEIAIWQVVAVEIMVSFLFCLLFCSITDNRNRDHRGTIPGKFIIALTALTCGFPHCTGPSMNPARTLGPALINNFWKDLWVYLVCPFIGAILAAVFWKCVYYVKPLLPAIT